LIATCAYAFQVYFDFSGYVDIAIGSAALLGYELPINFRSPFCAQSITSFWRRWHITLSAWLRDYVYISLGGNRRGLPRAYANLFLTMLISGLLHGASLNFVIWGGINGALLVAHRMISPDANFKNEPLFCFNWRSFATFQLFSFTLIFFRSPTLVEATQILGQIAKIPFQIFTTRSNSRESCLRLLYFAASCDVLACNQNA
jgi:alginate O-acetyltransferase complex protein AlgI